MLLLHHFCGPKSMPCPRLCEVKKQGKGRPMTRTAFVLLLSLAASCTDSNERTKAALEALQQKHAEEAKAAKKTPAAAPVETLRLPAPYDEADSLVVVPDGPCPDGLWALFPGDAPGSTPDEKKANAAQRTELAQRFATRTLLVKLHAPSTVTLSPYDAPNGRFVIEVAGTVDCTDALGRIALAWTDAKATTPPNSAAKEGAELAQNIWVAPALRYEWPLVSLSEAKAFNEKNRLGLSARVAMTPGKVEVDRKLKKVGKVNEKVAGQTLAFGGGTEDWGAGRLLRGTVLGVRLASDREKVELLNKR
jgi:hypothetical protein